MSTYKESVFRDFFLTKGRYYFPYFEMTNVKVKQIRKCAQSFTASKWENARSKPGSLALQSTCSFWYTPCCLRVLANLGYRNVRNTIMFVEGWALKSFGLRLSVVELIKWWLPPNSLTYTTHSDNVGYYA